MEKAILFEHIKRNFFPQNNTEEFDKQYLINVNTKLSTDNGKTTFTGVNFQLTIKRVELDLLFTIELFSWSNDEQKYTSLDNSIWSEEQFGSGSFIPTIVTYYSNIIKNFYLYLDKKINKIWKLKELIDKLENPLYSFNYKLLNLLPREKLENFYKKHFEKYPILNLAFFEEYPSRYEEVSIFVPNFSSGFYLDGVEVSVDLDESDFPLIEDMDSGVISNEEFFRRFEIE